MSNETQGGALSRVRRSSLPQMDLIRNPDDGTDRSVVRSWGGDRVWSTWLCYVAFLILLLLAPLNSVGLGEVNAFAQTYWLDKVVHFLLFTGLTGLGGCAFFPFCTDADAAIEHITPHRIALLTLVVATLGIGLEFVQPSFGRGFEWLDMAANLTAIIPGFGLFLVLNELRHSLTDQSA